MQEISKEAKIKPVSALLPTKWDNCPHEEK